MHHLLNPILEQISFFWILLHLFEGGTEIERLMLRLGWLVALHRTHTSLRQRISMTFAFYAGCIHLQCSATKKKKAERKVKQVRRGVVSNDTLACSSALSDVLLAEGGTEGVKRWDGFGQPPALTVPITVHTLPILRSWAYVCLYTRVQSCGVTAHSPLRFILNL